MTARVTKPSRRSRSGLGDPGHTVEHGFDHRVFLTYNASVMAVAMVVVVTNWSEPAVLALGTIMFAMSAFLLLMCGIDRLARHTRVFLNRQTRVSLVLMVGVSCLCAGMVSGVLISDALDGLLGRDALAASGESSDGSEGGAFWEQQMFHAMTTGDRTLFAQACGSLATLQISPGLCAGAGITAD